MLIVSPSAVDRDQGLDKGVLVICGRGMAGILWSALVFEVYSFPGEWKIDQAPITKINRISWGYLAQILWLGSLYG